MWCRGPSKTWWVNPGVGINVISLEVGINDGGWVGGGVRVVWVGGDIGVGWVGFGASGVQPEPTVLWFFGACQY